MTNLIILLFVLHWIGDFVCQTRWMADNKSKNLLALTLHVYVYSFVIFVGLLTVSNYFSIEGFLQFMGANFMLHWITDIITSQFTKLFWWNKDMHKFFMVVGFDQMIHAICLVTTANCFLT
jgi:hypothetical protein